MSIWLLAPSIRPDAGQVFAYWKAAGYRVAAFFNQDSPHCESCDRVVHGEYRGYGASVNALWEEVSDEADIVIAGSDDLYPCEQLTADQIAAEFFAKFPDGFGAMHLAAHDLSHGRSTDHLWFGGEYARRINGGKGPVWPEYGHFFDDTEAGLVAESLGVLWRRPELGQRHDHWTLHGSERPAHLIEAGAGWSRSNELFQQRKAAGFPGSEPLPK